jgi:hypothetical protein
VKDKAARQNAEGQSNTAADDAAHSGNRAAHNGDRNDPK